MEIIEAKGLSKVFVLKDGKQDKVERAARLARLITIGKRFLTEGGGLPV